jgi:NAD(P)-dependent dehydrogenase (short-subunit alcohol dehydrogenase family)
MPILDRFSLVKKTAVITGGRRGIGKAIAIAFAEAGADIAICDYVNSEELEATANEIRKTRRKCLTSITDVSRSDQVDKMIELVIASFGKIDILVNSAGISPVTPPVPDLSESDWDNILDINLKGTYLCCKSVSKHMIKKQSGSIINIASIEGLGAVRRASSPYAISKSGVVLLTRGLAWDLGKYNIRVNAIAPGYIRTEMTRMMWDVQSPAFQETYKQILKRYAVQEDLDPVSMQNILVRDRTPLGRYGEVEEIACAALFLASDAASFVTGSTMTVDGGFLA